MYIQFTMVVTSSLYGIIVIDNYHLRAIRFSMILSANSSDVTLTIEFDMKSLMATETPKNP